MGDIENVLTNALLTGLPFVLTSLGIFLILRVLDDFDLTVEGSYVLGAAVAATGLLHHWDPWLATAAGATAGALAGLVTSLLHLALRISVLLSGIIMSIALYSVNLRVMGRPNVALLDADTIIAWSSGPWTTIAFFAGLALAGCALFALFMRTELGLAIRGAGGNFEMVRSLGVNPAVVWIVALMICNGLVGLSGAIQAQSFGFADVNMGLGTIVAAAASILLGEALLRRGHGIVAGIAAVVVGTLVYRLAIAAALRLGISPTDLKLLTALLLIVGLAIPRMTGIRRQTDRVRARRMLRAPSSPRESNV